MKKIILNGKEYVYYEDHEELLNALLNKIIANLTAEVSIDLTSGKGTITFKLNKK